jgi:hypothetical protein
MTHPMRPTMRCSELLRAVTPAAGAADADWPDADWVRDVKVTGCSHEPEIEGT